MDDLSTAKIEPVAPTAKPSSGMPEDAWREAGQRAASEPLDLSKDIEEQGKLIPKNPDGYHISADVKQDEFYDSRAYKIFSKFSHKQNFTQNQFAGLMALSNDPDVHVEDGNLESFFARIKPKINALNFSASQLESLQGEVVRMFDNHVSAIDQIQANSLTARGHEGSRTRAEYINSIMNSDAYNDKTHRGHGKAISNLKLLHEGKTPK